MSNARKLSKIVLGTEVKISNVDSDLANTFTTFTTRLDSDTAALQAAKTLIASNASGPAMTDSDLKVVADLRNDLDSEILSVRNLSLSYVNYVYNATAGQTTFTGSDANTNTLSYTVGSIQVFLNGVRLTSDDFTATDGTSIVLTEAAALNNQLMILVPSIKSTYTPAVVGDAPPDWSGVSLQQRIVADSTTLIGGFNNDSFATGSLTIYKNFAAFGEHGTDGDLGSNQGELEIFKRTGTSWDFHTRLKPENGGTANGNFAYRMHMWGDYLVVGANREEITQGSNVDTGVAYIFHYDSETDTWSQQARFTGSTAADSVNFGQNACFDKSQSNPDVVAISANQEGTDRRGRIYIFNRTGSTWSETTKLQVHDEVDLLRIGGAGMAMYDGTLAVGVPGDDRDSENNTLLNSGAVYIFNKPSGFDWNNNSVTSSTQNYSQYGGDEIGVFDFSSDGNYVFVYSRGSGSKEDTVRRFPLSTAYDVTTTSNSGVQEIDISGQSTDGSGSAAVTDGYAMKIGYGGTRLYVVDHTANAVFQWNLSTANDLTSASYGTTFDVSTQATDPSGIEFNSDGTKMYVGDEQDRTVYEYNLSTAWDISSASYSQSRSFATAGSGGDQPSNTNLVATQRGIAFNNDGTRIYIICQANDVVFRFNLSTAYDISTATYTKYIYPSGQSTLIGYVALNNTTHYDLKWNPDGTKMYVGQPTDDRIRQYNTSGVWREQAKLHVSEDSERDNFGMSLGLWDGHLVASAPRRGDSDNASPAYNSLMPDTGVLFYFKRESSNTLDTWTETQMIKSPSPVTSGDKFGGGLQDFGIDMHDKTMIVGAPGVDTDYDNTGGDNTGAAYIFTRENDTWTYQATLNASGTGSDVDDQQFGHSVRMHDDTIVVGKLKDSGQAGDSEHSVYVFTRT